MLHARRVGETEREGRGCGARKGNYRGGCYWDERLSFMDEEVDNGGTGRLRYRDVDELMRHLGSAVRYR